MRLNIALPLFVACLATTSATLAQDVCDGPFKGKRPTPEQLDEILVNHKMWIDAGREEGASAPDTARLPSGGNRTIGGVPGQHHGQQRQAQPYSGSS